MRVILSPQKQKKLMQAILSRISVKDVAKACSLSERTIRDWRRAKFSIDLKALRKLCSKTNIPFPSNAELKDDYWYTDDGSSAGGLAVYKKYGRVGGDPEYRKKKWYEWWEREGQYRNNLIAGHPLPFKKPKLSQSLAEFVGIILGDGSVAERQIVITLHSKDDREYGRFIVSLIKKLFNVPVGTYLRKDQATINFIISRTKLVNFMVGKLGLVRGDKVKQQVDVPKWIKENKRYVIACIRGLIDTDGCVFDHRYKVNGKAYSYKKLSFTNHSKPLLEFVFNNLKRNKLNPRLARDTDVFLDSKEDMKRYFRIINSHNPKHLKRYSK
ncbi:hypothetical protein KJ562_01960 [Patescibacteria group bacterium]|nr:hypothetical protein [Patescibacteria group bacterium]MBU4162263.1 hypothetical protein [Patescibacteria group bacterium]